LHRKFVQRRIGLEDVAVFWDYPCLFQKDRNPEETYLFRKGLEFANLIYGHAQTMVLMQTSQPAGPTEPLDYFKSGWCQFESSVGSLNKWSAWYLDVSVMAGYRFTSFEQLVSACFRNTARPPPRSPERMKQQLSQAVFTNGKTDRTSVELMYDDIAEVIFSSAEVIMLCNRHWTPEDVVAWAEVLPSYTNVKRIRMWGIDVGESGAAVLAPAFKAMAMHSLQEMYIECCVFGEDTYKVIADTLPPNLSRLALSNSGGHGVSRRLSQTKLYLLADALAKLFREPTAPKSLGLESMAWDKQFVATIQQAWTDAGKDLADIDLTSTLTM